jgi:prephenate dehydrogenase
MWRDIALANRKNLSNALERFIRDLRKIQAVLKKGDAAAVENFFRQGKQRRDTWCAQCASPSPE